MPHIPLHPNPRFVGTSIRGTYGDVVEEIDWSGGKILDTLETHNLTENTFIFFTSDNGPWIEMGTNGGSLGPFKDGKGSTWEGGVRVPSIAYWPGKISKGCTNNDLITNVDLFPTLLNLINKAEKVTKSIIDRIDISNFPCFWNFNKNKLNYKKNRIHFYYGFGNELFAVRNNNWKLHIKTFSMSNQIYFHNKLPLLLNINQDISETIDLSSKYLNITKNLLYKIKYHKMNTKNYKTKI